MVFRRAWRALIERGTPQLGHLASTIADSFFGGSSSVIVEDYAGCFGRRKGEDVLAGRTFRLRSQFITCDHASTSSS